MFIIPNIVIEKWIVYIVLICAHENDIVLLELKALGHFYGPNGH